MKVRVFTLRWQSDGSGFDESELVAFGQTHHVLDVAQHFFVHEKVPVLVLVLTYRDMGPSARPIAGEGRRTAEDVEASLDPAARARFAALRSWRNQYARKSGKPPYVLFTNRQAAEMATANPRTLADLARIEGFGASRIDEFGEALLDLLQAVGEGVQGIQPAQAIPDAMPEDGS